MDAAEKQEHALRLALEYIYRGPEFIDVAEDDELEDASEEDVLLVHTAVLDILDMAGQRLEDE